MSRIEDEISSLKKQYEDIESDIDQKQKFSDFPLSQNTLKGLKESNYVVPTDIQRQSIIPALLKKDVIGVAETGSGKSLAYLIPVLEHLFINKWSRATGGLAALIISPTRELAYQLFETLRKVGKYHDFSAGLIIGGKNLHFERNRMDQCNILICTPGRLLQHMDENPNFYARSVEIVVIDEADRCLDMGFETCLNAIIENLPAERQTLLFSATFTNADYLKRLSLRDPVHVGKYWNDSNISAIPELLKQNYVVVELEKKITMLWSFIKNHLKQKILVFLASCKQTKYLHEVFCKLRPGISLLALYGTLNQNRRISIYNEFFRKNHVVLFATDIASRGLDFPNVDWIVQLDCPEDVTQYIHRAGRSARNKTRGESLLVLTPSEETPMINELSAHKIDLGKVEIDTKRLFSPEAKLKALCARWPDLKVSAQRAFIAYVKSVYLMKNKNIFDVNRLNFDKFAESLGLVYAPRIKFLERSLKKETHTSNDDDFITVKRRDHEITSNREVSPVEDLVKRQSKQITKAKLIKKISKKNILNNNKRQFDEDGNEINNSTDMPNMDDNTSSQYGLDISEAKNSLTKQDESDKLRYQKLVKIRHKKIKEKMKKSKQPDEYEGGTEENTELELSGTFDWDDANKNDKELKKAKKHKIPKSTVEENELSSTGDWKAENKTEEVKKAKKLKLSANSLEEEEALASMLLSVT